MVTRHEAQSAWGQLAVTAATPVESTKQGAVTTVEHADAVRLTLGHDDDVGVDTHANRALEMTHADDAVEVEGRRQHLHAVVAELRHEHEVVGCYPHVLWVSELQRSIASTAHDTQQRPITDTEHVDGVGTAPTVRHQQRAAVAGHRDAAIVRFYTGRVDDATLDASQTTAEESSHHAAIHAAERPRHALATAQHGHATQCISQHWRHANVRRAA
jgi:hypothetical protein